MTLSYVPTATYRLQLNHRFGFKQANDLVEYLHALGISHCYASPLLLAKPGSLHGYDIVDHSKINPEIGSQEEFEKYIESLHQHHMGLILDVVPNHMFIAHPNNRWWNDILENGPSSPYADYFDIDWHPPRAIFDNKVLLPLLDQQYGMALESQVIKVIYSRGTFLIELYQSTLPTDPKSWNLILEPLTVEAQKIFPEDNVNILELKSIVTALNHLPPSTEIIQEKISERLREKEVIKKRLETFFNENPSIFKLLSQQLTFFNGIKGIPRSFDQLEEFLNVQSYRLCFWRVANDEINFRRFFDIIEYAGIRVENPLVFEETHSLICDLVLKGSVDGLRIDHIDGLWDPEGYLVELQNRCGSGKDKNIYLIAEKILIGNEKLPSEWQLQGTVGYDYLNQLNGIFVFQQNKKKLLEVYQNYTEVIQNPKDLSYACKRLVLEVSLPSELNLLARRLDRIAEKHRSSQDFTAESLKAALSDVIACFPVYRSYIRVKNEKVHEEDRQYILTAILRAKRRNPAINASIYNFIQSLLLLEHPPGIEEQLKNEREDFVMRFQQLTGPVMAKGLEDTAFYRLYPLSSLNEVGADPQIFGINVDTFHKKNLERMEFWPSSMLASTTHDTKRSEDVRARINILSEIPSDLEKVLSDWQKLNQPYKIQDGEEWIPDNNEEYLLYQTLIGSWPLQKMDADSHRLYVKRIQEYMEKAIKEAKVHSSWINPNQERDQAVSQFIEKILNLNFENAFLNDFLVFIPRIKEFGMLNSLSQVVLKLTSPGVPDIYQGNEIWDFSLVDPDNRRSIDFALRKNMLKNLEDSPQAFSQYCQSPEDGRIKLFVTKKILCFRRQFPKVFEEGIYLPLKIFGKLQNNAIAYARVYKDKAIIVVAGRFYTSLMKNFQRYLDDDIWQDTAVELPVELSKYSYKNLFTNDVVVIEEQAPSAFKLQKILQPVPFALLESVERGG